MTGPAMLERRRFLEVAAAGLAGALAGCASLAAVPVPMEGSTVRVRISNHPRLAEPGGYLKVRPPGRPDPIYLLADGSGGYRALSPICTHLGCTVDLQGRHLVCPCHGSTYDRSGAVLRGPAEEPLRRYPTRVVDGVLEIDLATRQQRQGGAS